MNCLDGIVGIGNLCNGTYSKSTATFDLLDAPEINRNNIASIANSDYITGKKMLDESIQHAIKDITNDMMVALTANNFIPTIINEPISTGTFSNMDVIKKNASYRGIVINRANQYNNRGIKSLKLDSISIFPVNSVDETTLRIEDGGMTSETKISLTGQQINTLQIGKIVQSNKISVLLDNTNVDMYPSLLTCLLGCNGTHPNECGYVQGWNGKTYTNREGFGINATFSCECDYTKLLCKFSNSFTGNLIYLKSRMKVLEEGFYGGRLNNWVVYAEDKRKQLYSDILNEYNQAWNVFVQSMPNILKNLDNDCITCNSPRIITNV